MSNDKRQQSLERITKMSEHVSGLNRDQTALFPDTLEGYVDKDNPVRFIDAFINNLNMEKLGFKHALPPDTARTPPTALRACSKSSSSSAWVLTFTVLNL